MNNQLENKQLLNFWFSVLILLLALSGMVSCSQTVGDAKQTENDERTILNKYANFFELSEADGFQQLKIRNPFTEDQYLNNYYLLPHGTKVPESILPEKVIFVPVQRIIALSSTQWAPLLELDAAGLIAGISESMYVRDNEMQQLLLEKKVIDVAQDGIYKLEKILNLQPDIILYSPDAQGISPALERTGLKFLAWPDYFETNPLGRAEWLKVLGVLSGKSVEATAMFEIAQTEYQQLTKLVKDIEYRPTVFADKMFAGQWYIPGGKSYIASLFRDAGADYVFSNLDATASVPLDPEVIFAKASNADFWRIAQAATSNYGYYEISREDPRYANFKAFKDKKVLFCNTALTSYFERGAFEPHLILADFIHAFHPALLPDHKAVYHTILP